LPGLLEVVAVPTGCVAVANGEAALHTFEGEPRNLAEGATAVAWSRGQIFVADGNDVLSFSPEGERLSSREVGPGVSAMVQTEESLVIGFEDGSVEVVATASDPSSAQRSRLPLEGSPSSRVVKLLEGPAGSLIAGFANGLLGIWSLETGSRLHEVQLHGPVIHTVLRGQRLFAASEMGQHAMLDLRVFHRDYCDLMREVWDTVPVVWEEGRPRRRTPPEMHRCTSGQ